jgi:hypothetical protein
MKQLISFLKRPMGVSITLGIVTSILLMASTWGHCPALSNIAGVTLALTCGWTIAWYIIGIYWMWKEDDDRPMAIIAALFLIGFVGTFIYFIRQ